MELNLENIYWKVNKKVVVDGINLHVSSGKFIGLLGANGSGKSSLLKTIYKVNQPQRGKITFGTFDLLSLSIKETAKIVAVVGQEMPSEFSFTVKDIVEMGRNPHKKMFENFNQKDKNIVKTALSQVGVAHLANRSFQSLSGGEKQRVLIARALSQQTKLLILDEPTNHLDIKYQLEVLNLVKTLVSRPLPLYMISI